MKRLLIAVGLLLAGLSNCVTPVIPLPPPDPESFTVALSTEQDRISLSGTALTGSVLYVVNLDTGSGTITMAQSGLFKTEPMVAHHGDHLDMWTALGIEQVGSDVVCAIVDLKSPKLTRCP